MLVLCDHPRLDQHTVNSCTAGKGDTTHHLNSLTLKYVSARAAALTSISFSSRGEATGKETRWDPFQILISCVL